MNTQNGLKTFMSVLAEEQKTNKYLIYDFQSTKTPDTTPAPQITVVNDHTPLIGSLQDRFLATLVKLQSILQNNKKRLHSYSQPDEGRTSKSAPNHNIIQSVISYVQSRFASTTSIFESNETDHTGTELYLNANMVVLGMNAFIYESSRRTCSVKPLSSEIVIAENVPIVYGDIDYDC